MVSYSYLFKNFPWFVVIHIVKGFSIVIEVEVDVFLKFSCFFYDSVDVGNLILVPLSFLNPALEFSVHVLLKPSLEDFEHQFAGM